MKYRTAKERRDWVNMFLSETDLVAVLAKDKHNNWYVIILESPVGKNLYFVDPLQQETK